MVLNLNTLNDSKSGYYEAIISLTNKCNLACKHCYAKSSQKANQELPYKSLKKLFPEIKKMGVQIIALTGGEPLLHKDFFKIAKLSKKHFPIVFLATNGYFINSLIAKKIKQSGISNVQISIEGDKKIHDLIRGVSTSYQRARNAAKILKDLGVDVTLTPTFTKDNFKNIEEVFKLAKELKCDMSIKRQISTGRAKVEEEISSKDYKKLYQFGLKKNKEKGSKIFMHCDPLRTIFKKIKKKNILTGCIAGFGLFYIRYDGKVFPCSKLPLSMGNIHKQKIKEILRSPLITQLKNRNNLKGKCGKCKNKFLCGGCRAAAYAHKKELFNEDPACWLK
ncbi:MAG: radical SAM protein [Proteobacteria bacterium]|nr:radical SAM protein [Pseudomonadota bacterium]